MICTMVLLCGAFLRFASGRQTAEVVVMAKINLIRNIVQS